MKKYMTTPLWYCDRQVRLQVRQCGGVAHPLPCQRIHYSLRALLVLCHPRLVAPSSRLLSALAAQPTATQLLAARASTRVDEQRSPISSLENRTYQCIATTLPAICDIYIGCPSAQYCYQKSPVRTHDGRLSKGVRSLSRSLCRVFGRGAQTKRTLRQSQSRV